MKIKRAANILQEWAVLWLLLLLWLYWFINLFQWYCRLKRHVVDVLSSLGIYSISILPPLCLVASTQFLLAPHQPREECTIWAEFGWGHAGSICCPRETHIGFQPDYFEGDVHPFVPSSTQRQRGAPGKQAWLLKQEVIKVNRLPFVHYHAVWLHLSVILFPHTNTLMYLCQRDFQ